MARPPARRALRAALVTLLAAAACGTPDVVLAASSRNGAPAALLPGSSGKEPVSIDAAKLDYFDKEQKLVYSGDVVARQGESTLKASALTIYLGKAAAEAGDAAKAVPGQGSSIDRMEAKGPVMVISKDEVGTGDSGTYNKGENRITLVGNVTLTQGTNVIKGDRLVYDMTSGQAQVSGRVSSVFTPGSSTGGPAARKPKPAPKADAAGSKPPAATARTP